MVRYSGTKRVHQGASAAERQPVAAKASRARSKRHHDLPYILSAMRVLMQAGVSPDAHNERLQFYTYATAELTYLNGGLGNADHERINEIAAVFAVDEDTVEFIWIFAAATLQANDAKHYEAAAKALAARKPAVVAHTPLFETVDASRAFNKTLDRQKALFSERPGRDGIYTGLPNYHPGIVVVLAGPGTDRFTTAERVAMARELRVTTETVRTYERDKSEAEFDAWRERRRKIIANRIARAKKAARMAASLPRPKRWQRERKPGKTEAVHQFAARLGYSISHAWRLCKGKTTEQLEASLAAGDLAYIGGYDPRGARNESDKSAENPVFRSTDLDPEMPLVACVSPPHESEDESDKCAENPVFCCSFTGENSTVSANTKPSKAVQLLQVMAHAPETAEEATRIDLEEGPDSDAWWAV